MKLSADETTALLHLCICSGYEGAVHKRLIKLGLVKRSASERYGHIVVASDKGLAHAHSLPMKNRIEAEASWIDRHTSGATDRWLEKHTDKKSVSGLTGLAANPTARKRRGTLSERKRK